jgi:hypothetical protein
MKFAFASAVLLAAGLAGCGAMTPTPSDTRNDKEGRLPPGQGMFGDNATWEWRKKGEAPSPSAPVSAAEQEDFKKWRETAGSAERKEFEDWRAWQEWKKKNP